MWFKLISIFLYFGFVQCCRDEENNIVDWYVLYKLPRQVRHKNKIIQKGLAYTYITSSDKNFTWKLSTLSIADPNSMPGLTLADFYKNKPSMYIFYNDAAPPHNMNGYLGHTKGVLMSGRKTGFWLVHSVPLYPPTNNYKYPRTGTIYGQSFLCISLDIHNLNEVGKQLFFNEPNIYKSKLDASLQQQMPNIQMVISKKHVQLASRYNLNKIKTIGGIEFVSFAKSRKFGKDLYSDWVSNELKVNLDVESWLRGRGSLKSNCDNRYSVKNIVNLDMTIAKIKFKSENDHSKWAVSENRKNPWFCIGDINRQVRNTSGQTFLAVGQNQPKCEY